VSAAPVVFEHVTKRFVRGEYHDSMRDLLGRMLRLGRGGKRREWFNAVDDVSFEVESGQALGIIGPNGSGKSTCLKLLTGIYVPTSGEARVEGRVAPLIEVGAGFHPDLTGRENVFLNGAISGMTRAEIRARFDEIVAFSGLEDFLDTPVKRYSSGMYMRLGFSIAAHIPCEILVVDEVLAVGDVGFRARCIERMHELKREGRTILFVSHNPFQVRSLCDSVIYLVDGKIRFEGDAAEGTRQYEHDLLSGAVGAKAAGGAGSDADAVIEAVAVLHDASDEGIVLGPDEPLEVRVTYRNQRPLKKPPVLSVGFLRFDGVTCSVLNSREQGFALETEPGSHTLVARFDRVAVYPDKFSVEILLWDAEMVVVLDQLSAAGMRVVFEEGRQKVNRHGTFVPAGGFRQVDA